MFGLELLKNYNYSQEKQKQKLEQIYGAAKRLERLINDLLNMALLESGKLRLKRKKTEIIGIIQSSISNFEPIAAQKNQSFLSQFPKTSSPIVSVDANLIHRIIDNLLSNAIKFSPKNSQIIVNLEIINSGDYKIQVIDSGPGVPETIQQKIFEKYEIGTTMLDTSQIGLGLAFCKMAVEAHNGEITVINNQPQGAIFEITLPI
ncbi:MAG: ATP-binding protein [Cyanobacteria bacterium P01_H01_bin.35]